ncbi:MAG: BatD family protein [Bacteroidetes bacterium]|nr:BatD family protein [Bacteroidota bacterium]MBU1720096.1 BatD family protein [Bacteroidota bacterium]
MKHILKNIILILFLASAVSAQDVKFTAAAPSAVSTGQQFRLTYTVNAAGTKFTGPAIKNFNVLGGPNQSSSTSMQIINGTMTQSVSYAFTYFLSASEEGVFNIPAAKISVDGTEYSSNTLTIKVVKGQAPQTNQNNNQPAVQSDNITGDDIFVTSTPSKTKVYQGEPLVFTQKIFSKLTLVGFEDSKFPPFTGFWTEDVKMPAQITLNFENYNGVRYQAAELKKTILFPQKSGKLTIDPTELDCIIRIQKRRGNGFFDSFFGVGYENRKANVKSKPVTIEVMPFPENGKPIDFSGVAGTFQMKTDISATEVKANEPITLKIVVSGNGNLRLIDEMGLEPPPDIETYEPKINDNISVSGSGVSGKREFEYLLIPRNAGTYKIKPVEFAYFDLSRKAYVTLSTPEFTIKVGKGDGSQSNVTVSNINKEDVQYVGSDIRHIKLEDPHLQPKGSLFFLSPLYFLLLILCPLAYIFFIFLLKKFIRNRSDLARIKTRKASPVAKKRMRTANSYLTANQSEAFFEEVSRALWGYISDKLSIPTSDLSKDNVAELLKKRGLPDQVTFELTETLDTCEYARYSPSEAGSDMRNVYEKAVKVISEMENSGKL